jgi:hypothetical protein
VPPSVILASVYTYIRQTEAYRFAYAFVNLQVKFPWRFPQPHQEYRIVTTIKKGKKRDGKPGQVNFRTFPELTEDFHAAMERLGEWDIRGIDGRGQSKAAVVESLLCHLVETVRAGEGPTRELEERLKASQRAWVDRLGAAGPMPAVTPTVSYGKSPESPGKRGRKSG